jgi:hypothetical protein
VKTFCREQEAAAEIGVGAEQSRAGQQGKAGRRHRAPSRRTTAQGGFTKGGGTGNGSIGCSSAPVSVVLVTLVGWAGPFACFSNPAKQQPGCPPCLIRRLDHQIESETLIEVKGPIMTINQMT